MKALLPLILITLIVGAVAGCQNSAKDHNMTPEQHANM